MFSSISFDATDLLISFGLSVYPLVNRFNPIKSILCSSPSAKDKITSSPAFWQFFIAEYKNKGITFLQEELKKKEIDSLLLRIENLEAMSTDDADSAESVINVRKHLDDLLSDSGVVLNEVKKIQHVTRKCPNCQTTIGYDQHTRHKNSRKLRCPKITCNTLLISEYGDIEKKFILFIPEPADVRILCNGCDKIIDAKYKKHNTEPTINTCECGNEITYQYVNGTFQEKQSIPLQQHKLEITEELIAEVKSLLPPQPWEKHIHKTIANKLQISNSHVQRAINELIQRGDLYHQIDGELFEFKKVDIA